MKPTLYWSAPLFTQAERIWNRQCAEELRRRGYSVTLPQDEASHFIRLSGYVPAEMAELCYRQSTECDAMLVVLDGPDSDSGSSIEAGIKIAFNRSQGGNGKIIGLRTDFRVSEDGHLNLMFRLLDEIIYLPSTDENPSHLCDAVEQAVARLFPGR